MSPKRWRMLNDEALPSGADDQPGPLLRRLRGAPHKCLLAVPESRGPIRAEPVWNAWWVPRGRRTPSLSGVRIVSDSSCDLEQQEADMLNIEIVPLSIRFGGEEFTDRRDLSVEDFNKRMADSDVLPQTACPSPGAFEGAFSHAHDAGADSVVCLNLSSALSNTFQSAQV